MTRDEIETFVAIATLGGATQTGLDDADVTATDNSTARRRLALDAEPIARGMRRDYKVYMIYTL